MTTNKTISVARDFSAYPGPRYVSQGRWSGEEFRIKVLVPALQKFERLIVDLDGTKGYGSSFIDEAFGGLVRQSNITKRAALERIAFISNDDESYRLEALESIKNSEPELAAAS